MASASGDAGAFKLLSLVTLTLQNSMLTVLLHYSRISVSPDKVYSAAAAVLLNELIKMIISIAVSFHNATKVAKPERGNPERIPYSQAASKLVSDVLSADCWKLSIPACLYVIQNNLQFVAASNLDVPTFQVSYNLKILTTAVCSVVMLRKKLNSRKWFSLVLLAVGVALVQLQASGGSATSAHSAGMNRLKGLSAVLSACITSGLAGVYFEMVLKGSKTDLWVRNVQLSIFSIMPALAAVFLPEFTLFSTGRKVPIATERAPIFANFGGWAWAVVITQTVGGLVTALVIKYSDNIVKGFATSLAILISSVAGFILFDFHISLTFLVGASIVVAATWMYNAPSPDPPGPGYTALSPTMTSSPVFKQQASLLADARRSPAMSRAGSLDLDQEPLSPDHRLEMPTTVDGGEPQSFFEPTRKRLVAAGGLGTNVFTP